MEWSGVSKLPKVWIPRFDVLCLQLQRLKLSARKGILTVFIVLLGYPSPKICQALMCSSETGLNIQDWYAIEIYKLRKPYSIKKGTNV